MGGAGEDDEAEMRFQTRMVHAAALIAALALAGSASAQTTNTDCYRTAYGVNCTSRAAPGPYQPNAYLGVLEAGRQGAEDARAARARMVERQAGQLVAQGRCEEARSVALRDGNFDLAERVTHYCTPK